MAPPPTLLVCDPAWEPYLVDELQRSQPGVGLKRDAPGWIACRLEPASHGRWPIALAMQVLPAAEPLATLSISKGAEALGRRITECLGEHGGPWRLHVFTPSAAESTASRRRCQLIAEAVDRHLAKKQRRLRRSRVDDHYRPWQAEEWLIQLGLVDAERGWFASAGPATRRAWCSTLSRFAGGEVDVVHDPAAPSRAQGKLAEAEIHLEPIRPGQTCVDLGASPGGWTWHAAGRGAHVTAVDRSPLRDDLMRHANVTFVAGDAFSFEPHAPVDWLLCDVIAFPDKTLDLLRRWLENRWCRRLCVTVKFRRDEHYALLDRFKHLLAQRTHHFLLRRLRYNKNEVTAMAVVC